MPMISFELYRSKCCHEQFCRWIN